MVAFTLTPEQIIAPEGSLVLWVLHDHPLDRPDGYVLRPQFAMPDGTVKISEHAWFATDPDELRAVLPPGLIKLTRAPDDPPFIMETWI